MTAKAIVFVALVGYFRFGANLVSGRPNIGIGLQCLLVTVYTRETLYSVLMLLSISRYPTCM